MSTPNRTNRASQASRTSISLANCDLTLAAMTLRAHAMAASLSLFTASAAGALTLFLPALSFGTFAIAAMPDN